MKVNNLMECIKRLKVTQAKASLQYRIHNDEYLKEKWWNLYIKAIRLVEKYNNMQLEDINYLVIGEICHDELELSIEMGELVLEGEQRKELARQIEKELETFAHVHDMPASEGIVIHNMGSLYVKSQRRIPRIMKLKDYTSEEAIAILEKKILH